MAKDPNSVARKWAQNLSASTESIREGVMGVTESPTAKAADAADRMVAGVQAAVQSGKYQRGLRAVSLEQWKQDMLDKGLSRIAGGAQNAQPKMAAFLTEFLPHVEQVQAKVNSMPKGSLEANINRMIANARGLAQFKRRGGR